jgi:hypothetical protein
MLNIRQPRTKFGVDKGFWDGPDLAMLNGMKDGTVAVAFAQPPKNSG